jgi:hypothetical protein
MYPLHGRVETVGDKGMKRRQDAGFDPLVKIGRVEAVHADYYGLGCEGRRMFGSAI